MPDQIYAPGPEDAPLTYKVPGSQRMIPRACQALYGGSGASGDYVPALIFRSQAGHVISRAILDSTVVAGDDAEVSWFRGVKHAASAASGVSEHWCRVVCGATQPAGPLGLGTAASVMPISTFDTNTPADYVQIDANTWSIPDVPQTLAGYVQVAGGALTTLNGDVDVLVHKTSGFATATYGQNTLKFLIQWYAYTLTRAIETGGTWQALATGADTHNWVIVATYSAVY